MGITCLISLQYSRVVKHGKFPSLVLVSELGMGIPCLIFLKCSHGLVSLEQDIFSSLVLVSHLGMEIPCLISTQCSHGLVSLEQGIFPSLVLVSHPVIMNKCFVSVT